MPMQDAMPILGYAKGIKTDVAATDAAIIDIPVAAEKGVVISSIYAYNANGNNAVATLGVFTGPGGTGAVIAADAALATHTANNVVSPRTGAATATTPIVKADKVYLRVGTASGVAGSTIDVVFHGFTLP